MWDEKSMAIAAEDPSFVVYNTKIFLEITVFLMNTYIKIFVQSTHSTSLFAQNENNINVFWYKLY